MSLGNSKEVSVGAAELRNERIRGDEVREVGVVVGDWSTDQALKDIVGCCEDLGVYTEVDGEFPGEREHFLTYVVKKMALTIMFKNRRRA